MTMAWPTASLRSYLVMVILAASVPAAMLLSLQIVRDLRQETGRVNLNLSAMATTLASSVDRELQSNLEALELLSDVVGTPQSVNWREQLARNGRLRPSWRAVFVVDASGRLVFATSPDTPPPPPPGPLDDPQAPWVSNLAHGPAGAGGPGGGDAVALSVPLLEGPAALRLGVWMEARHWQQLLEHSGQPAGGFVSLFDSQHRLVARTLPQHRIGERLPASAIASMGGQASGVHRAAMIEGDEVYAAWQRLPAGGWTVGVGVPADPIDRELRRHMLTAVGTAALCLILGVTLALWMARRISTPLVALGRGEAPPAIAVREIAGLGDALASARHLEREARGRLQRKADEFEALFQSSPIGLAFIQDPDGRRVLRNRALKALMRPPSGVAHAPLQIVMDGQVVSLAALPLAAAVHEGRALAAIPLALRFGASGPARFVVVQAVPLHDAQGAPRGAIAAVWDVTAQHQLEQQRLELVERETAARRLAESSSQAKDELLAMLGHELRNPLNAIVSAAEVLKLLGSGGPKADEARHIIDRQTRHLARLMDDLLDMARMAAGQMQLARHPLDLGALVAAHLDMQRRAGQTQGWQVELQAEEAWVMADGERMEQVVAHLVANALKYTPAGGRVVVAVRARARQAVLEVRDTGPGIPPDLLPRIFDLFVQGQRPLDRQAGGLGVGLTLVRRIVQASGGEVAAASSADGSVFTVTLPRIDSPATRSVGGLSRHVRAPRSVLLIEDNADALAALCAALELDGHELTTAQDGESGLAALLAQRPQVAVIDIGLPRLTGFEVARRSRGAGYAGRLIALSGYGEHTDVRDAMRAGFDAHLPKPVDFDRLRALLDAD